jgi:hypothetical protein
MGGRRKGGTYLGDPFSHRPIVGLIHAQRHVADAGQERQHDKRKNAGMNGKESIR